MLQEGPVCCLHLTALSFAASLPHSGEDESEQLQCYMEALGVPSEELLADASRAELFFDPDFNPEVTVNSHGRVHCPGAGKT